MLKIFLILFTVFILSGCSLTNPFVKPSKVYTYNSIDYDAPAVEDSPSEMVSSEAVYRSTMKPYCVRGKWYYPIAVNEGDTFYGKASWYGPNFHGRLTSNGERYNMHKRTAASKTLPINTYVRVINLDNGRETVVRINDRGPFVETRIIDLSYQAAKELGMIAKGVANIKLEVISNDTTANRYAQNKPKPIKKIVPKNKKHNFFVQVASLSNKSKVIQLKNRYKSVAKNYRTYLIEREKNKQKVFKLLIGRFSTLLDAKTFMQRKNLKNAFVVKD